MSVNWGNVPPMPLGEELPRGTKVVARELPDGFWAVKLTARNDKGEQLYGVFTKNRRFTGDILTLKEIEEFVRTG